MTFVQRMIGASALSAAVYEEVEADKTATGQATLVVVLSALAAGIGSLDRGVTGLVLGAVTALLSWYVWAYLTYFIGTKWFPEPQTSADHGELLRTLGFAAAPGILRVFGFLPYMWGILFIVTGVWMLISTVIAVRQALDYESTGRAIGVCLVGWLVQTGLLALLYVLLPNVATGQ
jgi:hypothetical protein